ncbi:8-oxo-dGTP diphosphatase [Neobacillus mesonae]|nr:8-oxo-dGTP diphosphatase [Neobacillus mesonae]
MIKYNICFIKKGDRILLLNRNKSPWMGCWNGVGGKLETDETPRESMQREVMEETGLVDVKLSYKGLVTWVTQNQSVSGMYLYLGELEEDADYSSPMQTEEGILDWKAIDWILHPENRGITSNIPVFLPSMLKDEYCYEYQCIYENNHLVEHSSFPLHPNTEEAVHTHGYLTDKYGERSAALS